MIVLPIILGIYLVNKFRLAWKYWLVGGITFIVSQIFHIPFNTIVLNPTLEKVQLSAHGISGPMVVAILLGLSAGLFETAARFIMYRWWLKDARSWRMGIIAGAGHGGVESILLGGLVLLVYVNMVAYKNIDLSGLKLTAEQLTIVRQQIETYWSMPWYAALLGALERIFTIPFHIAASVIVLQVFSRKPGQLQLGWLALAVFLHAVMDASAVFIAGQYGVFLAEAIMGGLAVIDLIIIFALRQPDQETVPPPLQIPAEPPVFTPIPIEETSENLENTRYQ